MEDSEKMAKLAKKIESTSLRIKCLISDAQCFDYCLKNVASEGSIGNTPSMIATSLVLADIRKVMLMIEDNFSDIRSFIDENY